MQRNHQHVKFCQSHKFMRGLLNCLIHKMKVNTITLIEQFSTLTSLISLSTSLTLYGIWVLFFRMKKKNCTRTSPYFWTGLLGNNFCRVIVGLVLCDIKEWYLGKSIWRVLYFQGFLLGHNTNHPWVYKHYTSQPQKATKIILIKIFTVNHTQ